MDAPRSSRKGASASLLPVCDAHESTRAPRPRLLLRAPRLLAIACGFCVFLLVLYCGRRAPSAPVTRSLAAAVGAADHGPRSAIARRQTEPVEAPGILSAAAEDVGAPDLQRATAEHLAAVGLPATAEPAVAEPSHGDEVQSAVHPDPEQPATVAPATAAEADDGAAADDEYIELRLDDVTALSVKLLPSLSGRSSSNFLMGAAAAGCGGSVYRAENFLVQGRIDCAPALAARFPVEKGPCPADAKPDEGRKCPAHDPSCGCHGPLMTRGMVGWAGGGAGPDWFVYTGEAPAIQWANDHTVRASKFGPHRPEIARD